jgi:hypothetical protein
VRRNEGCPLRPIADVDYSITLSAHEKRLRNGEANRLRGVQIDESNRVDCSISASNISSTPSVQELIF